jgi:hypothetical protein
LITVYIKFEIREEKKQKPNRPEHYFMEMISFNFFHININSETCKCKHYSKTV